MAESLAFDFAPPLADVSKTGPCGEPLPPVQGQATGAALHCSSMGAKQARVFNAQQRARMLAIYAERGPLTDVEMETISRIDKSSVTPRRNELIAMGLVEKDDGRVRKNLKSGVNNTLWRLKA